MKIADYLALKLSENGVRYVFGVPGGPSIPYIEAFKLAGIDFILTSNEAAAAVMADVTARITGTPGVCHATFGPGATNITTGTGEALLDRSPLIVLTSEISDQMVNRTTQMNINHQKLFEPVTKATFRLSPGKAGEIIDRAFKLCREEYPGPVHIGLPSDLAGFEAGTSPGPESKKEEHSVENDTAKISDLLNKAKNPLIAIGLTAARLNIGKKLNDFLDRYEIPVVLTPMAKGVINEDHPCYAGVLFHVLSDYLEDIFEGSDLIIGLGYDPVEYNYESWIPSVPLVHFDTRKTDLPQNGITIQYAGHPDNWFDLLQKNISLPLDTNLTRLSTLRKDIENVFEGFTGHFGPVALIRILMDGLPQDSVLTADVGSHLHLIGQYWKTKGRRNLLMTNGWSGMGFGIPAAIAVSLENPSATVVCVTGDGGFLMMAGEMITARRYNLPVIFVVISDGELNLIRLKKSWQNLSPYGTILYTGDLFTADNFLGLRVLNADTDDSMRQALNTALLMRQPVIINAKIDPDDYNWLVVRR
jgi:acetolactate synthase-1/2/3 large subunit